MSQEDREPVASTSGAEANLPKKKNDAIENEPTTLTELTAKIIEEAEDPLMMIYREKDEIDTDSDSDESDIVIKPAALEEDTAEDDPKTKKFGPTVKGELTLDDLPPVEKLKISVPQDHLQLVGEVFSFVDRLVVVESTNPEPVLNLETVLFLEDGRAVGLVFDVIGPVIKPYYVLRFNNSEEIKEEHLEKGVKIFCAPSHADYTFFVFEKQIREMMKLRGSDASWEYDLEPPEHELEYSDDEQEREARKERRAKRQADGNPVKSESARPQPGERTSLIDLNRLEVIFLRIQGLKPSPSPILRPPSTRPMRSHSPIRILMLCRHRSSIQVFLRLVTILGLILE
ncbi:H/ACA ribonucleoprotein complex non-core subunit NAF1 [Galendromus occidentalis]|uniref:H/ACA ribonucleoprotein complex subunit n=1 Tax=Galendromus occidentalis TaxID=34638 RepID=A0AAJ7PA66_9ACAR|nr:H/ACA ribonucleoprotein complex non-core subunit NAF1 [Galendromus occidentalis]